MSKAGINEHFILVLGEKIKEDSAIRLLSVNLELGIVVNNYIHNN